MKSAVIYSSHLTNRTNEPDNNRQIALCKEYAEQHGIEIVGSFMDHVPTKKTPLLMKRLLLQECRKQRWDMVLFSSITILGRDVKKIMKFLSEVSKYVEYKIIDQENDELMNEIGKLLEMLYREKCL